MERPCAASGDGHVWVLRLGDHPAERLYTVLIDGVEAGAFDDRPPARTRP